jgi:hypothetical protein
MSCGGGGCRPKCNGHGHRVVGAPSPAEGAPNFTAIGRSLMEALGFTVVSLPHECRSTQFSISKHSWALAAVNAPRPGSIDMYTAWWTLCAVGGAGRGAVDVGIARRAA